MGSVTVSTIEVLVVHIGQRIRKVDCQNSKITTTHHSKFIEPVRWFNKVPKSGVLKVLLTRPVEK